MVKKAFASLGAVLFGTLLLAFPLAGVAGASTHFTDHCIHYGPITICYIT